MTVAELIDALGKLDPELKVVSEIMDHTSPLVYYGEVVGVRIDKAVQWTKHGEVRGFYERGDAAGSVPLVFMDIASD